MYREQLSIMPSSIFLNMNFENVKRNLKTKYRDFQDLGSLVISKSENYVLTINEIGKVVILYNHLPKDKIEELLTQIEQSFKISIDSFSFEKKHSMN